MLVRAGGSVMAPKPRREIMTHLTVLRMSTSSPFPYLPSLTHLAFGAQCTSDNGFDINNIKFSLAPNITHLKFSGHYFPPTFKFPAKVVSIATTAPLTTSQLPKSLRTLRIPTKRLKVDSKLEGVDIVNTEDYKEGYEQIPWSELDWNEFEFQ